MAELERNRAFESAVAEIDRQIEELQRTREGLLRLMGRPPGDTAISTPSSAPISGDSVAAVREQEFSGMSAAKAAKVFLQKIGRHEKTPIIIAALRKGGVEFGGKNPVSTMYTTLSRRPGFVALGKNYWDLAERRPDLAHEKKKRETPTPKKRKRKDAKRVVRPTQETAASA